MHVYCAHLPFFPCRDIYRLVDAQVHQLLVLLDIVSDDSSIMPWLQNAVRIKIIVITG